jgi:hypothetical protein
MPFLPIFRLSESVSIFGRTFYNPTKEMRSNRFIWASFAISPFQALRAKHKASAFRVRLLVYFCRKGGRKVTAALVRFRSACLISETALSFFLGFHFFTLSRVPCHCRLAPLLAIVCRKGESAPPFGVLGFPYCLL